MPFFFQFCSQFLIDFICSIFSLIELMSFFLVDVELFALAIEYLLKVEFLLVIENFVSFMAWFYIEENFLFGRCDL